MADPEYERLLDEAAEIFLGLRSAPKDPALLNERDEFLKRGQAERNAYSRIARAWAASGQKPRVWRPPSIVVAMLVFIGAIAYFSSPQIRLLLLADHITGLEPQRIELSTGDIVDLDASSALADNANTNTRNISLLRGAAFFTVQNEARSFIVTAGDVTVEALGTAFEISFLDHEVAVATYEGLVKITADDYTWQLNPGERFVRSDSNEAAVTPVELSGIASWRGDRLVADGMTFAQVAAVLDRRLTGEVVVFADALRNSRVTGSFDLQQPMSALRLLAATRGAHISNLQPVVTVILPAN
ncbi:MAG: FecR domain-containing protein [Hyphomicrobiales bacterium]|nr:FecR domain-containing protein [Hyphomicrobiales bacterium]